MTLHQSTCCQKCGSQGYMELLVYCSQCNVAAEHWYCLDVMPADPQAKPTMLCQDCRCATQVVETTVFGNSASSIECENRYLNDKFQKEEALDCHSSDAHPGANEVQLVNEKDKESETKCKRNRMKKLIIDDIGDLVAEVECHTNSDGSTSSYHNAAGSLEQVAGLTDKSQCPFGSAAYQEKSHKEACNAQSGTYQKMYYENFSIPVRPLVSSVWRGCFVIGDYGYGPIAAHLSSRACAKVHDGTKLLTPILQMEKLPRLATWPKSFMSKPPTDDNIALYFFPTDSRTEDVVDFLLDDLKDNDHMLKVSFDMAELLVYHSVLLPEHSCKFDGKYYLWGVFKRRQVLCNSQENRIVSSTRKFPISYSPPSSSDMNRSSQNAWKSEHQNLLYNLQVKDMPSTKQEPISYSPPNSSKMNRSSQNGWKNLLCHSQGKNMISSSTKEVHISYSPSRSAYNQDSLDNLHVKHLASSSTDARQGHVHNFLSKQEMKRSPHSGLRMIINIP